MSIRPSIAALAAVVSFSCFAAEESTQLGDIVVTPTRSAQNGNTTSSGLVVITRKDIERSGASHIADVLRARAGVEVIDTFGDGSRTLVGLRGFGENAHSNTLILLDGRRLNNSDIGAPDLNSISLERVDRIEILTGSAGALYGDQAIGGVINIITIKGRKSDFHAELAGGSYERGGLKAGGIYAPGNGASLRLDAAALTTDNYRDNNELKQINATARGAYDWNEGSVFLEYQRNEERLQLPGALLQAEVDADRRQVFTNFSGDYGNTDTDAIRLGAAQRLSPVWALEGEASYRVNDGLFRIGSRFGAATAPFTQDRQILGLTPRATATFDGFGSHPATLTVGTDLYRSDYKLVSSQGPQRNDQEQYDGYAQLTLPLTGSFGTTTAIRYGRVENNLRGGGGFAVFPAGQEIGDDQIAHSVGVFFDPSPGTRVFTRYDHNFRFAKVDEFFGANGFALTPAEAEAAALKLRTQTGNSFEIGADSEIGNLTASLQAYRLYLDNELAFDPSTFSNFNLDETRRDGQLLELRFQALDALGLIASYTHIETDVRGGGFDGKRVPLSAEHVGRLAIDYTPLGIWRLMLEVQATSDRAFSGDFDNSLKPLAGYAVVNVVTELRLARSYLSLRLNNILDKEYSEFGSSATIPPTFSEEPSFFPSPEFNAILRLGINY